MIFLGEPDFRDASVLNALRKGRWVGTGMSTITNMKTLVAGYRKYRAATGCPHKYGPPAVLPKALTDDLKALYHKKIAAMRYIKALRANRCPVCSMCGGMGNGTLDHVFPKSVFPELSICSRNLVPSCTCNSNHGVKHKGTTSGERILHPYFDKCLKDRLVTTEFVDRGNGLKTPHIELVAAIPASDPMATTVAFHIEWLLKKSGLTKFLPDQWIKIQRDPAILHLPGRSGLIRGDISHAITNSIAAMDARCGTKNNWDSMLLTGIQRNDDALDRLAFLYNGLQGKLFLPQDIGSLI